MKERKFDFDFQKYMRDVFTDDEGDLLVGIENGKTIEGLLLNKGIEVDLSIPEGREFYSSVQIQVNYFMGKVRKLGYPAGSVSRSPSYYFIAKNESERKLLLHKQSRNIIGRLNTLKINGRGIISIRSINKIQKELSLIKEELISEDFMLEATK